MVKWWRQEKRYFFSKALTGFKAETTAFKVRMDFYKIGVALFHQIEQFYLFLLFH